MRVHKEEDIHYIKDVLNGNTSSFKFLIQAYQNHVFNIIYRVIQHRQDAEELAQDVFIKVYNSLSTFKSESKFSTWLYSIAYNTAISHQRKKKIIQMPLHEEILNIETEEEFFNDFEDVENLKHLHLPIALQKIPAEGQTIITMYYQQKLSISEISDITNISKSNVKIKLYRSRKLLRDYINEMIQPIKSVS